MEESTTRIKPVKKAGHYEHTLGGLSFFYTFSKGSDQTRDEPATPDELVVYCVFSAQSGDSLTEDYDNGLFNESVIIGELLEAHYENN
jgi:hypothetical protein